MSVKWRRNKKVSKKFEIIDTINKVKSRKTPRTFSMKKSRIRRWKALPKIESPKIYKVKKGKELEPLIDVLEEKDEIVIVAEAKGVNKDNLKIQIENQRMTLAAEALEQRYRKSLNLPARVIPDTIRTRYKNGVLEIRLKKAIEQVARRVAD